MADRIIVVDDEREIADLIGLYLENDGYEVHKFLNGADALSFVEKCEPALAVLDVMLPDTDGFALLLQNARKARLPDNHAHRARHGLGQDTRPDHRRGRLYNKSRLTPLRSTARVQDRSAPLPPGSETNDEMDIRGLTINRASRRCSLFGRELALTPTEFDILWYLCDNAGRVVASEELFEAVWKEKFLTSSSNTVMAHIGRLREKMHEPARKPKFIKTVWGVGYEIEK